MQARLTLLCLVLAACAPPPSSNRTLPCVSASHERVDFGAVEVGCSSPATTLTFTNTCAHPVRLTQPRLPEGVTLISAADALELGPGAHARFRIVASPARPGLASGTFEVDADVLDGVQTTAVVIEADVLPAPRLEETTITDAAPRLDVLFVLDDLPRMLPHASSVHDNLGWFARYLSSSGLDARVAVMSTSLASDQAGRLRRTPGGAGWLDAPTPEALSALGEIRGMGTGRSSCLEALESAFTSALRDDATELGGFLRPGTPLYVVCITNGRDEIQRPVSEVLATLDRAMPAKKTVAVVARFQGDACPGELEHGPLRTWALQRNGILEDLCASNWGPALERVGTTSHYVPPIEFAGEVAPERGPLQVFIDGAEVPEQMWRWNALLRAIEFQPVVNPPPASRVTFRYTPACPLP